MKRRHFLKSLILGIVGFGITPEILAKNMDNHVVSLPGNTDDHIRDYLYKMRHFDEAHKDDIHVHESDFSTFVSVVKRLRRLERTAGHGNFQILSFDSGLNIGRKYSDVGEFTGAETDFIEKIFYSEASRYGFFGKKTLKKLTDQIPNKDVTKIDYTGNYVFKGVALKTHEKIKREIGEQVILTSGVRGVMKQCLLFLNKAFMNKGNLSLASRSLAPPGYSFHGNGDFDVGQAGFGIANFTDRFTTTKVYEILSDLGYLKLRYPQENLEGVRYEPWHIKVMTDI
ncbi:MAG: hypothetical protein AMK70_02290 [Nitrospira bacterium SG8_35_1]|nr:MAG: hypothetical protein AMK70_02290 [Nitrospira bacterium SG8_35_1]